MHLHHDQLPLRVKPTDGNSPWLDPSLVMPLRRADVGVLLPDGTIEPAVWTGTVWWRDRALTPIAWRDAWRSH